MKENYDNGSGWKFWFGLFAGIAAGMYLNSDHGRRFRKESSERLNQLSKELNEKALTEVDKFSGIASESIEKSKDYAGKAKTTLKEKVEKASHVVEDLIDRTDENYEKAADWAVSKLTNASKGKK